MVTPVAPANQTLGTIFNLESMRVMEDSYRKKMGLGQDGNALIKLIIVNAVLFVSLQFIHVIYLSTSADNGQAFYTKIFTWFSLPANLDKFSSRPWTMLTYAFTDMFVPRFIANMVWLWGFGYILQDLTGNGKLIPIYLYGALAGAAGYLMSYALISNLHPQAAGSFMVGANPAVIAIAVATTAVSPDYRIFPMINGGLPLWALTLVYILMNFYSMPHGDSGIYIANIAGAAVGFLFIYQLRRGYDLGAWINNFMTWCNELFDPNKKQKITTPKDEFYYKVSGTQPFRKIPNITQKRIDDILDKINQQGYRYLTDEEKEILKRAADKEDL